MRKFADRQIARGKYTSPDDMLLAGLQALAKREQGYQGRFEALRQDVLIGAAEAERG
ncbi:transcriptional regulator [Phormidium sp. FACHB-1136]|nr:transcriptional regulator [Phormidium sp. FACHB-1136]